MFSISVLVVTASMLSLPDVLDRPLPGIQAEVARNEGQVRDLTVEVVNHLAPGTDVPKVIRQVWAFKLGAARKEYYASTEAYPASDVSPDFTSVRSFNGEAVITLALDPREPARQVQGSIWSPEAVSEVISSQARDVGVFPKSSGLLLQDRSLSQWLAAPGAHVTGSEMVEGRKCVSIEIPYTKGSTDWVMRCFLAPECGYALARYESIKSGQPTLIVTNTDLREVLPGIWLPLAGIVDASRMETSKNIVLEPHPFEVLDIKVNTNIPDTFFDIEFAPGTPVVDFRFSPVVPLIWGEGYDISKSDWVKKVTEGLGNETADKAPFVSLSNIHPPAATKRPEHNNVVPATSHGVAVLSAGVGLVVLGISLGVLLVLRQRHFRK